MHAAGFFRIWGFLRAESSSLATLLVPLLLHALTLPSGPDILWKVVEQDFNTDDWKIRFEAGTSCYKPTLIFMNQKLLRVIVMSLE